MKRFSILAASLTTVVALGGCGDSNRRSDAEWARDVCLEHGGVQSFSPDGYYQDAGVVCEDGTVGER